MKDYSEILEEVLKIREQKVEVTKDAADGIIEKAIYDFEDCDVTVVWIKISGDRNVITVEPVGGTEEKFSDLVYGKKVFQIIKNNLNEQNTKIRQKLRIDIGNEDDLSPIFIELKE